MDRKNWKIYEPPERTQGKKGKKLPRINMAFDNDVYQHIREKAAQEQTSMTRYVNATLRDAIREEETHEQTDQPGGAADHPTELPG